MLHCVLLEIRLERYEYDHDLMLSLRPPSYLAKALFEAQFGPLSPQPLLWRFYYIIYIPYIPFFYSRLHFYDTSRRYTTLELGGVSTGYFWAVVWGRLIRQ